MYLCVYIWKDSRGCQLRHLQRCGNKNKLMVNLLTGCIHNTFEFYLKLIATHVQGVLFKVNYDLCTKCGEVWANKP
jgi:hypothetical protein